MDFVSVRKVRCRFGSEQEHNERSGNIQGMIVCYVGGEGELAFTPQVACSAVRHRVLGLFLLPPIPGRETKSHIQSTHITVHGKDARRCLALSKTWANSFKRI